MYAHYDLGGYSRPVTTRSPVAQREFDLGLNWRYGFNHEAAIACFERARAADPDCAMAHWGVAWAAGPFYNRTWADYTPRDREAAVREAHRSVQRALALVDRCTPVERALIHALLLRYPSPVPADDETMRRWHDAHVGAMRRVYAAFSDDLDVAALFAEAMMNRTPWRLWDTATGEPSPSADTEEVIRVLADGLAHADARGVAHPGLPHFQIHALEMSPSPERALAAADRLRHLAPDAGHLLHMPSHIDVQVGRYAEAIEVSDRALAADRRYLANEGPHNFYTSSRCHTLHMKIYAAMLAGRYAPAITAAEELVANLPASLLRGVEPPLSHWLEGYVAMRLHVLVRFGRWRALTREPPPDDPTLYRVTTPITHYARGVAHAALNEVEAAERERRRFREAAARVPDHRMFVGNRAVDLLAIASAMLDGEIDYRRGAFDSAFAHLRRAIQLGDTLPYDEPWGWMQPVRHALGALLLEQDRVDEAAAVYRADLGLDDDAPRIARHPNNVWALQGYVECLDRLGRTDEADAMRPTLAAARARADTVVSRSCLCRREPTA